MDEATGAYGDQLVAVMSAAARLLKSLPSDVTRLSGTELGTVLSAVDEVGALCDAARYTIARNAEVRGEVGASQAGSTRQWVAAHCQSLEDAGAGQVAKAVRELEVPDLAPVRAAVSDGSVSVPAGCVVAAEWRAIRPQLVEGAEGAVLAGYVSIASSHGRSGVRALRPAMLARYGLGERIQAEQNRRAYLISLSAGADLGGGLTEYRLRLDPEGRAAMEAAIGPLSAPVPGDGGLVDGRSPDRRRGDALVAVCRRATAAGNLNSPSGVKATVFVTVDLADLQARLTDSHGYPLTIGGTPLARDGTAGDAAGSGARAASDLGPVFAGMLERVGRRRYDVRPGVILGGLDAGTLLGPETVRRLACDAQIIPTVLGGQAEILELGRAHRLFTRGQITALALRDARCTFPACDIPAHWCDAHHLTHWADGGRTELDNAALLCGRHHSIVHRDRLAGTHTPTGTDWDTVPGSYDRALVRAHHGRSDTVGDQGGVPDR